MSTREMSKFKCPCDTCKKVCHQDNCNLSSNSNCKVCGKGFSYYCGYFILHTEGNKALWQEETGCCDKECYDHWILNIDKFEKKLQSEIKIQTLYALSNVLFDEIELKETIRMDFFIVEYVMMEM